MNASQPLLFNPSRASIEELEQTFVGRWQMLGQIESNLIDDAKKRADRHWLLIGPRGSGKSHLTELLGRRLGRDHGWAVVRLPEEQYQVANLAQLLEQIVVRLEQLPAPPFFGRNDLDVQELALDRIRAFRKKHGQQILVVLENLARFFERKLTRASEQKRLREILSRDAPFVLLTTATSYVDATLREGAPFYDFFHVITLEDLSQEEVASLVEVRAKWDREETLLSQPDLVRSRVESVYHFSGGNPRLVLDLYSILRRGITDDLHQQLLKLLDEVTPYYQARLSDITPQMERVLTEMAMAEERLTPAEVGRRCRLPTNQVTANIAKLEFERFVRPSGRPDGRRRYYEVRDRLLRLWIQMREDDNRSSRLRPLTEFFQRWYGGRAEELHESAIRVGNAFWRDVEEEDGRKCQEKFNTLEYLETATVNEPNHSLLVRAITDARLPTDPTLVRHQTELLRKQFDSASPGQYRAALAYRIASRLHSECAYTDEIQLLASVSQEATGGLRYALWDRRVLATGWAHGSKAALALGLRAVEADPGLFHLKPRLVYMGIRLGRVAEALRWMNEFVTDSKCPHCQWRAMGSAFVELIYKGLATDARALLRRMDKFEQGHRQHLGPNQRQDLEALKLLIGKQGHSPTATQWRSAISLWPTTGAIPPWFLNEAACSMAHTSGLAADAFPLLVESYRRGPLTEHEVAHVALAMVDALAGARPNAQEIVGWAALNVNSEGLQRFFFKAMPVHCRSHPEQASAVLEAYRRLRELSALPTDLQPWSTAAELEKDPDREKKLLALHPELREAIDLLLAPAALKEGVVYQPLAKKRQIH